MTCKTSKTNTYKAILDKDVKLSDRILPLPWEYERFRRATSRNSYFSDKIQKKLKLDCEKIFFGIFLEDIIGKILD